MSPGRCKIHFSCSRLKDDQAAFTLVELLVVIGIISVLVGFILPAINSASSAARTLQCESNVRQICQALIIYATANKGKFPPNLSAPARVWYETDRIGALLTPPPPNAHNVYGPIATCPNDPSDTLRSYAMNVWASCEINANIWSPTMRTPATGAPWNFSSRNSSKLILISETWTSASNPSGPAGWVTPAYIGSFGDTPGRRFGLGNPRGGVGVTVSRWGLIQSELTYFRHRLKSQSSRSTEPVGRIVIGYADGHVAPKSNADLVDSTTGLSTLDSWWSPLDPVLNK
jgi:prepilin-type N-terminal cleavage/methylation domain-containing protein